MAQTGIERSVTLIVSGRARSGCEDAFAQWQARWQNAVLAAPGALSCDLWPANPPDQEESVAVVRFDSAESLRAWRASHTHRELVAKVEPLVENGWITQLTGVAAAEYYVQKTATELIVTKVRPGKEAAYRAWVDRMQEAQNAFAGFRGALVHAPHGKDEAWTTLLRFDTMEHLEAWLASSQRLALLKEAEGLTDDLVVQHLDSAAFPGWVPNDPQTGKPPNPWKTACLVLLVLLPIVMLEVAFLDPQIKHLNRALWALIDVVLGVTLTTALMPLAVRAFGRWIFTEGQSRWVTAAYGAAIFALYVVTMAVSWNTVH